MSLAVSKSFSLILLLFIFVGCDMSSVVDVEMNDKEEQNIDSPPEIVPEVIQAPTSVEYNLYADKKFLLTNESISILVDDVDGTGDKVFSISPALPSGLSINTVTGEISGSTTDNIEDSVFTITVTNSEGSASTDITLTILDGFRVDVGGDNSDDDGGSGDNICLSTVDGGCSLRAAIETANNMAGKQLILLDSSVMITAEIINTDDLIISSGDEKSIQASGTGFRLLTHNTAGKDLYLYNLDVQDFNMSGVANGGVVYTNSTVTLLVEHSNFSNNRAIDSGVFHLYGGVVAEVNNSTFYNNSASATGAVYDAGGSGTDIKLFNIYGEGNSAAWGSFAHICTNAVNTVENAIFYQNQNSTHGLFAVCTGKYTFKNITAIDNTSTSNTGAPGIYLHSSSSQLDISNSIFANNTDGDGDDRGCHINSGTPTLTSFGGNIFTGVETSCSAYFDFAGETDINTTDPQILAGGGVDNGGFIPSILVQPTSPAIDFGTNSECSSHDMRGVERFFDFNGSGANCDSGAIEMTN